LYPSFPVPVLLTQPAVVLHIFSDPTCSIKMRQDIAVFWDADHHLHAPWLGTHTVQV